MGFSCLRRRGVERTVALSVAKVVTDGGQKTLCLGITEDNDECAAETGIDGIAHAAGVRL